MNWWYFNEFSVQTRHSTEHEFVEKRHLNAMSPCAGL
jgi:hypothetical protein